MCWNRPQLHCAVLAGPHTNSAPRAYDAVLEAQGFGRVASSADIAREAARLLARSGRGASGRRCGGAGAASLAGAVARTMRP